MADDNTIIEGTVKFRDGKKWKSRWCVMRKLSPVADCVQMELYRDAKARWAGGVRKASLSLAQFVGYDAGFTLDKHSNTLALLCLDHVAVLAFDTRERLIQWQVKVNTHLGEAKRYLVIVSGAIPSAVPGTEPNSKRLASGPATLLVLEKRIALAASVPPKLLAVWEIHHLRRYGVVEGRFCLEGGSACGSGEGLHVFLSDQANDIARDVVSAARGELQARGRRTARNRYDDVESPKSFNAFRPDTRLSELQAEHADCRDWPSAEPRGPDLGIGDASSLHGGVDAEWAGGTSTLERCSSCMSKLGALSRSSTAALTPGARHFTPAWTMDALSETAKSPELPEPCRCPAKSYDHPPKLTNRVPTDLPLDDTMGVSVGPYENYDIPKLPSSEIEGEYYDTPKRLKESLSGDLFHITKSYIQNALIVKRPCGCLLKLRQRTREPTVVDADDEFQPACPCRRVTDWANDWIPSCMKSSKSAIEIANCDRRHEPRQVDCGALYATVDVSQKSRRRIAQGTTLDPSALVNYENLEFALSLRHYENSRDVVRPTRLTIGQRGKAPAPKYSANCTDEYLLMEPGSRSKDVACEYAAMLPSAGPARETCTVDRRFDEKSASNPALRPTTTRPVIPRRNARTDRGLDIRRRSSSADSSRFLDDVKEFEGASTSSSMETLRNVQTGPAGSDVVAEEEGELSSTCGVRAGLRRSASAPRPRASDSDGKRGTGWRSSSSSNDSGVSACGGGVRRRTRSSPPAAPPPALTSLPHKSSSAEAEVPLLSIKRLRGAHSRSSSGTSDLSDYIETLSLCSSHSSTDAPLALRLNGASAGIYAASVAHCTLRPRSGTEYRRLDARRRLRYELTDKTFDSR